MKVRRFISESGFKVLAMARLSQAEYGVVLYLLNTAVSGLDRLVTTEDELATSLGHDRFKIHETLKTLSDRNIVKVHYADGPAGQSEKSSFSVAMQFDISLWHLDFEADRDSHDAIIYPFRRQGKANFLLMEGNKKKAEPNQKQPTWSRVLESYERGRTLDDEEKERAAADAHILIETHPVDQILLLLRHFGLRIPTLSLLASSWQHFQELFESETQKIDMLDARQKHHELDEKVRAAARTVLEKQEELSLSEEERTVLQILAEHRYPRRQLFWAYQSRSRYPRLGIFLEENATLMLSVTTAGQVVKKHHD